MIGYLRGKVQDHTDGKLLLVVPMGPSAPEMRDVSDVGAIGYAVNVPMGAGYGLFSRGKWVELYIYTHVREDALDLFGFLSPEEKELFLTLLNVNGIGPKVALAVISGGTSSQVIQAILEGDKAFLTRIPGVGKKTAERIVMELADSIRKKVDARVLKMGAVVRTAVEGFTDSVMRDAKDALIGLGYREADISTILQTTVEGMSEKPKRAEELIRAALRRLSN